VIYRPKLVHIAINNGEYVSVGRLPYKIRRGTPAQAEVIIDLITEASKWLRSKNTKQWAKPWPDAAGRYKRIEDDLSAGRTWIVWDGKVAIATITIDTAVPVDDANNHVWPAHRQNERALYVHRVVVRRSHAGIGLGAELLDWASRVAMSIVGAPLVRIDVWTDNWALHDYYLGQGFKFCESRNEDELPDYPARALFERRAKPNGRDSVMQFIDYSLMIRPWPMAM
jgi:GNAT superfamily N-acetyltransferase